MSELLNKEIKLASSILSYLFLLFGFMTMLPGYPILMGAFFICFGLFQTYQRTRENNDILYSALLPIAKSDVVKAKFIFCLFIEICGFLIMTVLTVVRMTLLVDAEVYLQNALLSANFCFLGYALLIFAVFNLLFIRGFFKTAYYFGKPFIFFIVAATLVISAAEALPHFPGLEWMNSHGFENMLQQGVFFAVCLVAFVLLTLLAYKKSIKYFEEIDI